MFATRLFAEGNLDGLDEQKKKSRTWEKNLKKNYTFFFDSETSVTNFHLLISQKELKRSS